MSSVIASTVGVVASTVGFVVASMVGPVAEGMSPPRGAVAPAGQRLIDTDKDRFFLLKKLIVIVEPGYDTDGIASALKVLGLKVYDTSEACKNHERDFPLWHEAAQAKEQGVSYERYEYDKLTGRYDALVGGPSTFLADDLCKLYTEAKVIFITRKPESTFIDSVLRQVKLAVLARLDPSFFGFIASFMERAGKTSCFDHTAISAKRLLVVDEVTSWDDICNFLEQATPKDTFPTVDDNGVTTTIDKRAHLANTSVKKSVSKIVTFINTNAMIFCFGLAAFVSARDLLHASTIASAFFGIAAFHIGLLVWVITAACGGDKVAQPLVEVVIPPSPVTSGPRASQPPVDRTSQPPIARTSQPPVPKISRPPVPNVSRAPAPKTTPVPVTKVTQAAAAATGAPQAPVIKTVLGPARDQRRSNGGRQTSRSRPASRAPVARPSRAGPVLAAGWGDFQSHIHSEDRSKLEAQLAAEEATSGLPRAGFQHRQVITGGPHKVVSTENCN
ncbi:hypothetical protein K505DRAFT_130524 [Melanomma pulvis-pyrius CBS 109.77]|uniref:Uncharacterized protein n=1 Tax=Melanomma pulvis-pyrius CBS 109.77 TaxID=1314802 RepID=A0A6A6WSY9_9PLEO|nr:hypothetical protein K505DRAFT_130524 [Melanomma pulvis-pyrius CBS 109.77]